MNRLTTLCLASLIVLTSPVYAQLEQIRMVPNTPDYVDAIGGGGSAMQFANGDIAIIYKIQTDYSIDDFGPDRLYMITSMDGGDTWSDPEQIDRSNDHQGIGGISTAISSNGRAIISYFNSDVGWKMLYSDDNGSTWSTSANSPDLGNNGVIAEGEEGAFVVTYQSSAANGDIQWIRTSPDGLDWNAPQQAIETDGVGLCNATIAQTGETNFLLIYEECFFGTGVPHPIMQVSSNDGGATWSGPSQAIVSEASFGARSDVTVAPDGTLWLLHTNNEDLYFTTSTDGGVSWAPSTQWTDNSGMGNNPGDLDQDFQPKLTIVDDNPFAVFVARRGNDWFHMFYGIPGISSDPLATSIEPVPTEIPSTVHLNQNYPNPFNPATAIEFSVLQATHARLTVYNVLGEEVARLVDQPVAAGTYRVAWEATGLPSGPYFYRLTAGPFSKTRRMLLVK